MKLALALSALLLVTAAPYARAATGVPTTVSFVARLTNGAAPLTGTHELDLALFDAATGGTPIWTEDHAGVDVPADGVVFLELGTSTALDATTFDGGKKFLEITIDGQVSATRIPIGSAPYAVRAGVCASAASADTLQSHPASDFQLKLQAQCGTGQSIQTIDPSGAVTCETDANTVYTAGTGLTLTGGTVFSIDPTKAQARVTGTCVAGKYVTAVNADGSVVCGIDANTQFTAGTGLTLTSTTFSVDTSVIQARVNGNCSANQAINAIADDGSVTCESNITNQSAVAQAAAFFISGIARTSATVRVGVENGTTDLPTVGLSDYAGVVHRRIVSSTTASGSVIARTDGIALVRGAGGTAEIAAIALNTTPGANASASCYGVSSAGAAIGGSQSITCATAPCAAVTIVNNTLAARALTCVFGNAGHDTEVTMRLNGNSWIGFVTSTFNQ